MILLVLVLSTLTTVIGSTAGTSPSSIANGPTAEEMFPQFALSIHTRDHDINLLGRNS